MDASRSGVKAPVDEPLVRLARSSTNAAGVAGLAREAKSDLLIIRIISL